MQIVNTGSIYRIYDNSVQTSDKLPAQCYQVDFNPQAGFYLTKYDDIKISEKIYGVHLQKVQKILGSFKLVNRNLGVILSGDKGIGKSLFAKLLAARGIEEGYPLIIVNCYYPGIADFLVSIQQEVVVLFDEFDKTFSSKRDETNSINDPQTEMLTLFDGLSQGKKLFVITCNELRGLNDYLVNRPGRFHYHIRFEYPTDMEVKSYLEDQVPECMYSEINKVIAFSHKVNLNYDCLRAIAFELTLGSTFEDAIKDLNIIRIEKETYNAILYFKDGGHVKRTVYLDLFEEETITMDCYDENGFNFYASFESGGITYDYDRGGMIVDGKKVGLNWLPNYYDDNDEEIAALKKRQEREVDYISLRRAGAKNLHYAL